MIVCLVIPEFVVKLEQQKFPEMANIPLVVYQVYEYRRTVYAMCKLAKQLGVKLGMTKNEIQPICYSRLELDAALGTYDYVSQTLCEALMDITWEIEFDQTSSLSIWLECRKLSTRHAKTIGSHITKIVQQIIPIVPLIGIAEGRRTARIAALTSKGEAIHSIPPGKETYFLAGLPLASFAENLILHEQFDEFDLKTLDNLAQLPFHEVETHFGKIGTELYQFAHGQDRRSLSQYRVKERIQRSRFFDVPVNEKVILESVFPEMSQEASEQLIKQGLTCYEMTIIIQDENKKLFKDVQMLRKPAQTQKAVLSELNQLLEKINLSANIVRMTILFGNLARLEPVQLDFFEPLVNDTEKNILSIIEYLSQRYPECKIIRPTLSRFDSYLSGHDDQTKKCDHLNGFCRAGWLIDVTTDENNFPCSFIWYKKIHPVATILDTWHLETAWWHIPSGRDYFRLITKTNMLVIIYRNCVTDTWFLRHLYD